jgi:D-alanine-D-alanine ligase
MSLHPNCATLTAHEKSRLRLMFLAKHAHGTGTPDPADGNHAIYHHELKTTLQQAGFHVIPASSFADVERRPDVDFVITLLNRAGFEHSEMLAPLQLVRHGIPFLGASPMLRGLADDKHLFKLAARARGVPTADWHILRRGGLDLSIPEIGPFPWVVKPNASSASFGVSIVSDRSEAMSSVEALWALGHDVIVERWEPAFDVAVPVIGAEDGSPWLLPAMTYHSKDGSLLRSYEEKRGLVDTGGDDELVPVAEPWLNDRLSELTHALLPELWPFDYGRFEFRYDPATRHVSFMEVNLSCNLWSKKSISRSAATLGITHVQLVEAIVAHSLRRQGVAAKQMGVAA